MKLDSVQILRALAAILVLIYHIRAIEILMIAAYSGADTQETPLVSGLWEKGFAGVDLFFVISGFIMVYVTGRASAGIATASAFLFSRASRIYPLWWVFATIMALYFLFAYGVPMDIEDAMDRGQSPAWHFFASYLLLPQDNFPVLGVGWTLVHEMYFYIVFAVFLLAPWQWRSWLIGLWGAVVISGSVSGLSGPFAVDYQHLIFYPMTLEFILGAFSAVLIVNGYHGRPALLALLGATLLIAALIWHPNPVGHPQEGLLSTLQWGRVIWFAVPSVILLHGLVGLDIFGRLRVPGFFVALGDWSFALYLSHMLTLSALKRIFPFAADIAEHRLGVPADLASMLRVGTPGLIDNCVFLVASIIASIIVAALSFYLFEKPSLRLFGRVRSRLFDREAQGLHPAPIRAGVW